MSAQKFAALAQSKTLAILYVRDALVQLGYDSYDQWITDNAQKTLQFDCVCSDGKTPDVSQYVQTVPFYVCQANFAQCIQNHPDDADGQKACKEAAHCGSKNASSSSTTTTASSSSSATTTLSMATSTDDSSSETSSSVAAAATTSNPAIAMGETYSTGLMAGAMFLAARMLL